MIHAKDIWFTYPSNEAPTIKGVNFEVKEGEIFGFLGPSGSGKSTIQKLLIGLLKGFTGDISILGKKFEDWGTEIYRELGVGFELPNSFSQLTGLENIKLFASLYGKKSKPAKELLELVGLGEAGNQRVKNYSKGMMMRLNFLRAIMHEPELLFLDEPTAGLDPVNARKLKDIILDLKKRGKTIFLTTHNMHDADELCDRVAFIVEGEIKLIDEPRKLKLEHGEQSVDLVYLNGEERREARFALRGLRQNPDFMKILEADSLETIHSKEATLEDVFIKTTGRSLR